MIALLLLAAASPAPAPVLYSAQSQSNAYRDCVADGYKRRPATVVEIGRGDCARTRARLVAEVRDHVSFGWAAAAKTAGQARRLRAQLKLEAEAQVAAYEAKLQAWLVEGETLRGSSPAKAGAQINGRAGSRPSPGNQ